MPSHRLYSPEALFGRLGLQPDEQDRRHFLAREPELRLRVARPLLLLRRRLDLNSSYFLQCQLFSEILPASSFLSEGDRGLYGLNRAGKPHDGLDPSPRRAHRPRPSTPLALYNDFLKN